MKKTAIHALFFAALSPTLLLAGCIKDTGRGNKPKNSAAVRFATTIAKTTRAGDNEWESGDGIGVYMLATTGGDNRPWAETPPLSENMRYHNTLPEGGTSINVVFEGVDPGNTLA